MVGRGALVKFEDEDSPVVPLAGRETADRKDLANHWRPSISARSSRRRITHESELTLIC
jgi:hypothetical protein